MTLQTVHGWLRGLYDVSKDPQVDWVNKKEFRETTYAPGETLPTIEDVSQKEGQLRELLEELDKLKKEPGGGNKINVFVPDTRKNKQKMMEDEIAVLREQVRKKPFKYQITTQRGMLIEPRMLILYRPGAGKTCTYPSVVFLQEALRQNAANRFYVDHGLIIQYRRVIILCKSQATSRDYKNSLQRDCNPENDRVLFIFQTYGKFTQALHYSIANEKGCIQSFVNTLVVCDEIQNVCHQVPTVVNTGAEARQAFLNITRKNLHNNNSKYLALYWLSRSCPTTGMFFGTGTPMRFGRVGLQLLLSLLVVSQKPLTIGPNDTNTNSDWVKSIAGKVSFVREPYLEGVRLEYQGDVLFSDFDQYKQASEIPLELFPDRPKYVIEVYPCEFVSGVHDEQLQKVETLTYKNQSALEYLFAPLTQEASPNNVPADETLATTEPNTGQNATLYTELRMATNYVEGIDKYTRGNSSKFFKEVEIALAHPGKTFSFQFFIQNGLDKLEGYYRHRFVQILRPGDFTDSNRLLLSTPAPRMLFITAEDAEGKGKYIIRALAYFNKRNNVMGEYIKGICATGVLNEGYNLKDVTAVFLHSVWDPDQEEQAMRRVLRADAYQGLRQRVGPDVEIVVKVYRMMAIYPKATQEAIVFPADPTIPPAYGLTIDQYIFSKQEDTNRIRKKFEKLLVEAAWDCHENIAYNTQRPGDRDFRPECFYEACNTFHCFKDAPTRPENDASFNVLYSHTESIDQEKLVSEQVIQQQRISYPDISLSEPGLWNISQSLTVRKDDTGRLHVIRRTPFDLNGQMQLVADWSTQSAYQAYNEEQQLTFVQQATPRQIQQMLPPAIQATELGELNESNYEEALALWWTTGRQEPLPNILEPLKALFFEYKGKLYHNLYYNFTPAGQNDKSTTVATCNSLRYYDEALGQFVDIQSKGPLKDACKASFEQLVWTPDYPPVTIGDNDQQVPLWKQPMQLFTLPGHDLLYIRPGDDTDKDTRNQRRGKNCETTHMGILVLMALSLGYRPEQFVPKGRKGGKRTKLSSMLDALEEFVDPKVLEHLEQTMEFNNVPLESVKNREDVCKFLHESYVNRGHVMS